jgi:hypothetical protein
MFKAGIELSLKSLDKRLSVKTSWQALRPDQSGQALDPFRSPVRRSVVGSGMPGDAASGIALGFARFFVGLGVTATAALDAIEFLARGKVAALVTASQMSVCFEMDNHEPSPG